jgi:hypothetical protein
MIMHLCQSVAASAQDRLWHECDIARSRMDVRFRRKSGRAADITGTTEFDPTSDISRLRMGRRSVRWDAQILASVS